MPGETIDSTFASGLILTTLQTNPVVFAATNTIVQTASTALYSNIAYT